MITSLQPIQIILLIFLFFAISRVYLQAQKGTLSWGEGMFWTSLFTIAVVGVIDPGFTTYLAQQLGIGRGADIVLYFSIVLLFYLIFRTNVYLEDLRHDITQLVREIALLKDDSNHPPTKKKTK